MYSYWHSHPHSYFGFRIRIRISMRIGISIPRALRAELFEHLEGVELEHLLARVKGQRVEVVDRLELVELHRTADAHRGSSGPHRPCRCRSARAAPRGRTLMAALGSDSAGGSRRKVLILPPSTFPKRVVFLELLCGTQAPRSQVRTTRQLSGTVMDSCGANYGFLQQQNRPPEHCLQS